MEPLTKPSKATRTCTHCPKMCRFACPVAEASRNERHTPWAKQATLSDLVQGRRAWTRDAARSLYACADCHGSIPFCAHGITASADLLPARAQAVERGAYRPAPWVLERFAREGTPFARAGAARLAELAPGRDATAGTVLFPGCASLAGEGDDVRAAARWLGTYRTSAEALCGGYPLLALGYEREFRVHRDRVASALRGARRIVSLCPACNPILREATGAEVVHPLELAARPSHRLEGSYAFHDPCHLSRTGDFPSTARSLLDAAFAGGREELLWYGRETRCAGGGGGLPATHPKTAHRALERRVDEFRATCATTLVTACGNCLRRFRRALPGPGVVRDALDVLLQASGAP